MRKRFVKLLLFKVDTQYRLLYGFSSETEQSSYLWKAFPADKKGQKLIVKAILSPSEADNFSINLTGTEPIMLCERVEANTGCVISLGFINAWRCKARDSTPTVQQDIVLTVLMAVSIQIGTNIQVRKNWL